MLKHNVCNHRKDEDPACLWLVFTVLVAVLLPFLSPPASLDHLLCVFPSFFPSPTSLFRACSPPFTLSLTFRGTWWKSSCPTELVSLYFILPASWHACAHFCMRWQLRGPLFFCFFLFSDTVLFVPVKPYSDGLLNRFVLQNLPQVSEKVNKSTYILYPSAHAGVRGAEPACGCVQ